MQRVGGAIGDALVVVLLARGLPLGVDAASATAFLALSAMSVLALTGSLWLRRAEHGGGGDGRAGGRKRRRAGLASVRPG